MFAKIQKRLCNLITYGDKKMNAKKKLGTSNESPFQQYFDKINNKVEPDTKKEAIMSVSTKAVRELEHNPDDKEYWNAREQLFKQYKESGSTDNLCLTVNIHGTLGKARVGYNAFDGALNDRQFLKNGACLSYSGPGVMEPTPGKKFTKTQSWLKGIKQIGEVIGGSDSGVEKSIAALADLDRAGLLPKVITCTGHSRGSMEQILFATAAYLIYGHRIRFHLVLSDPIPGVGKFRWPVLPPNVDSCVVMYAQNDKNILYRPLVYNRTATNPNMNGTYFSVKGVHGTIGERLGIKRMVMKLIFGIHNLFAPEKLKIDEKKSADELKVKYYATNTDVRRGVDAEIKPQKQSEMKSTALSRHQYKFAGMQRSKREPQSINQVTKTVDELHQGVANEVYSDPNENIRYSLYDENTPDEKISNDINDSLKNLKKDMKALEDINNKMGEKGQKKEGAKIKDELSKVKKDLMNHAKEMFNQSFELMHRLSVRQDKFLEKKDRVTYMQTMASFCWQKQHFERSPTVDNANKVLKSFDKFIKKNKVLFADQKLDKQLSNVVKESKKLLPSSIEATFNKIHELLSKALKTIAGMIPKKQNKKVEQKKQQEEKDQGFTVINKI